MKILFVTNILADGGAERVVSVISDQLAREGTDVGILIQQRKENEYYINPSIKIFEFKKTYSNTKGNSITRTLQRIKMIRRIIKDYRPDFIIPFLTSPVRESFVAKIGLNVKQISTIRNNPREMSKLKGDIQRYVFNHSDRVWLQTDMQKQFISNKAINKSFVLPNPVNEKVLNVQWKKIEHDTIELIMMGRLHEQKNYPMLFKAVSIVHERYPNIKLNIFGQGPLQDSLRALINNLDANNYITLCGRTNNPVEELLKSDIFVFSSNYEGMPNALMEAMAVGMPCISTDCPTGPKELIGDNERGSLVPVGDSQAMADAIINMIENQLMAEEMGKKAKQYVTNNFSPEIIARKLIENLEKIK